MPPLLPLFVLKKHHLLLFGHIALQRHHNTVIDSISSGTLYLGPHHLLKPVYCRLGSSRPLMLDLVDHGKYPEFGAHLVLGGFKEYSTLKAVTLKSFLSTYQQRATSSFRNSLHSQRLLILS